MCIYDLYIYIIVYMYTYKVCVHIQTHCMYMYIYIYIYTNDTYMIPADRLLSLAAGAIVLGGELTLRT